MASKPPANTAASPYFPCQICEVRETAICSVLNEDELRRLNAVATTVTVAKGSTVFREHDPSNYLFNVLSGAIRLVRIFGDGRRQVTGFLFPGDFLGLSASGNYSYSAETLSHSRLCRFDRTRLARTMEALPKLERKLLQLSQNELSQAEDHLLVLGRKTATERVSTVLLKLAERIGRRDDAGWQLDLPMDREDLADYLGLTPETVSRTISMLRQEGLIVTRGYRGVHIPKSEDLALHSGDF